MQRTKALQYAMPILMVIVILSIPRSATMAQQIVGHWNFDEGSGNVVHDSSGKNNAGEIVSAKWAEGISGKALAFVDYTSEHPSPDSKKASYVRIKHSASLSPTRSFDLSAAINIDASFSPSFVATILQKGEGYGCSYRLLLTKDFKVRVAAGTEHATLESTTRLTPGKWISVRASFDGQKLKIFIDGKEDASTAAEVKNFSNPDDVIIGWRFTGKIDEVRISVQ